VAGSTAGILVSELLDQFLTYAETHYRTSAGKPTDSSQKFADVLEPVNELYGDVPAIEFGPIALKAVRQAMIDKGWARGTINRQITRVRRVFRWAASEELVPASVPQALAMLQGLQRGRSKARDCEPIKPVPRGDVEATLPHLNRHLRTMVQLQMLTGMRPGEICRLTMAEVNESGDVWVWRPSEHKTAYRDGDRIILFGPRAQQVIREFQAGLSEKSIGVLFSPRIAREERYRELRAKRKTKVPPSQKNRRKLHPEKPARDHSHATSYAHAIGFAAKRGGVPHWHPNQIRHLVATEVRQRYGLEAAQVILSHARADTTEIYAERDLKLGMRIASEVG
jgi:integrase